MCLVKSLRCNTTSIGLKFDHCYLYGRTSVIICNIHELVGVLVQRDGSYFFSHIRYSSVFMKQNLHTRSKHFVSIWKLLCNMKKKMLKVNCNSPSLLTLGILVFWLKLSTSLFCDSVLSSLIVILFSSLLKVPWSSAWIKLQASGIETLFLFKSKNIDQN